MLILPRKTAATVRYLGAEGIKKSIHSPLIDGIKFLPLGESVFLPSVAGVAGGHHVLAVEHLLGQLGHGQGPVECGGSGGIKITQDNRWTAAKTTYPAEKTT